MNDYKSKVTTADEAVKRAIKDGDGLVLAHAAAYPTLLAQAIVNNKECFKDLSEFHLVTLGEEPLATPEAASFMRPRLGFLGGNTRDCIAEGRGDFVPMFFHEIPRAIREGDIPCDVLLTVVSYPDENGYCSFGVSSDYTKPAAEKARCVVVEMNKQMPYVGGDNKIHLSDIDYIVETDRALPELPPPSITEVEKGIGRNVAKLVKDGDTLQLGIGAIPDAVLLFLDDKKDLGLHTEMFSDGAIKLIKKGVINGSKKQIGKGKHVATFLMGTKELYDFVDHNPDVELYPVDYVNHPCTIMQLDRIVSINSCIEIDLMGQVNSETIGSKQFSGVGGQVDYIRGAAMSKEGISILAIPSTARRGTVSRIVPTLAEGAAVTTSRNDIQYVVTEYGIAKLKGKSLRERAEALIAVAHPDFREELAVEMKKRFPQCK